MFDVSDLTAVDAAAWAELKRSGAEVSSDDEKLPGVNGAASDYFGYLQIKNRPPASLPGMQHEKRDRLLFAKAWAAKFLSVYLTQIRAIICEKRRTNSRRTKGAATASASGLAAWAAAEFGVSSPVAIAIAAVVIHTIASAGLQAFCLATEAEILESIARQQITSGD